MLSPLKRVLEKCHLLLMKMAIDLTIVTLITSNLDQFCDFQVMFGIACLLLMLIIVHSFINLPNFKIILCVIYYYLCKVSLFQMHCH